MHHSTLTTTLTVTATPNIVCATHALLPADRLPISSHYAEHCWHTFSARIHSHQHPQPNCHSQHDMCRACCLQIDCQSQAVMHCTVGTPSAPLTISVPRVLCCLQIDCQSQALMQSTVGTPSAPGSTLTSTLSLTATPISCPVPPPPPTPPPSPTPNPGFQDRPEPQLSVTVTKTYVAGAFAWAVASSVTPSRMEIYAGSSSTAQYSVKVTRSLSSSPAPNYLVDGVITVTNPSSQAITIQAVNALLPWNVASPATCSNLNLPGTLNPGAAASCSFRLNYELGPQPSSVRCARTDI